MALTKSSTIDVVDAWQAVTAANMAVGSVADLSDSYNSIMYIETAAVETVAHGTGTQVIVEVSYADDEWTTLTTFRGTAETGDKSPINVDATAADGTIAIISSAGDFDTVGRKFLIKDATIGNSEAVRTKSATTVIITLAQDLIRAHLTTAICYDRVDDFVVSLPTAAAKARLLVNNDDADCDIAFTSRISKVTAVS